MPPFIAIASGCAPPIPPTPAVNVTRPCERSAEVPSRELGKGLVRPLNDALRADVDPRAGRHLAVHRQSLRLQLAKDAPVGPLRHEICVGDQDARRAGVRLPNRDGLAALNDQRLVVLQPAQGADDRVEGLPGTRGAPVTAVNDEVVRTFGDLRIEVVHQHPQRGFLRPADAGKLRSARRPNGARTGHNAHALSFVASQDDTSSRIRERPRMLHTLGRSTSLLALAGILAASAVPAQAGTTGSLTGQVVSTTKAPIAGARVVALSPSQTATVTTDASGRFALLSLSPETYTITVSKEGFDTTALTGISIFADQLQTLRVTLAPSLRTIAHVTARSSMDLVKSGTTSDVYSVNSTVTAAAAGIGGGGNLNNAYSAIAAVPGTFVPPNQQGWNETVYIRGGNFDQVGYEFDGVPVNRSFDNYPGSTAGTLGQQELQVYAGGGTAGESASGLAGFINQVIKTGTFPGYATVSGGIGTPTYYHNLQVEAGGATPDRLFSYYVGIGGYNQDYRYLNQFNGSDLGNVWGYPAIAFNTQNVYFARRLPVVRVRASTRIGLLRRSESVAGLGPLHVEPGQAAYEPLPVNTLNKNGLANDPGCYATITPAYNAYGVSNLADRESVVNLHIGVPHRHDAGRDDIQVLYNVVALQTQFVQLAERSRAERHHANSANMKPANPYRKSGPISSPGPAERTLDRAQTVSPPFPITRRAHRAIAARISIRTAIIRTFHVAGECAAGTFSAVPPDNRDSFWNNASIFKLQYQHNIGSNAYVRLYGYTFYSDWLQTSALSYGTPFFGFGALSYDYELESHTRGLSMTAADQFSSQHLLTFDANYVTATTNRYNNNNFNNFLSTDATTLTNGKQCFAYYSGSL